MILSVLCLLLFTSHGFCLGRCCCEKIKHAECREVCEQLKSGREVRQLQRLVTAAEQCPEDEEELWQCAEDTATVLKDPNAWSGRLCCEKSSTSACKSACHAAHSKSDLKESCVPEEENVLYSCVDRILTATPCCSSAKNFRCQTVCQNMYLTDSLTDPDYQQSFVHHCSIQSQMTILCVLDQVKPGHARSIQDNLPCCEEGDTQECRDTCKSAVMSLKTENDKTDMVIGKCGQPSPMVSIWKCFLKLWIEKNKTSLSIIDGAKLQCCRKALTGKCRDLCKKTFSSLWGDSSKAFHTECLTPMQSLVDPMESPMQMCIKQVDEPCKLGCDGLQFCTNFNNRPVELFRSCNAKADNAAKYELRHWQKGVIILPQMRIPVKDIKKCKYDMWKAIACALQVKPCHGRPTPLSICREDCIYILSKCINYRDLPRAKNVSMLCSPLPSRLDSYNSCVSISKYLKPSPHHVKQEEVTNPCKSNPCNDSHICMVNRRKCKHPENCRPYVCKPACPMGEVSLLKVPRGSYVRLPSNDISCSKVCHCSHKNKIDHCQPLPCVKTENCVLQLGHIKMQNVAFMSQCNFCTCYAGKIICTKRQCVRPNEKSIQSYTGLPCNCKPHHAPVCARNGKTYPNRCLALCAGFNEGQLAYGNCSLVNPCAKVNCGANYRCIPRRQVCLGSQDVPCEQYVCVFRTPTCSNHYHQPVCDTLTEEFTNLCMLHNHGRVLAYWGHCWENCRTKGFVCGHNGETYNSECEAFAHRTTVDYLGICRTVGQLSLQDQQNSQCFNIECPEIRPKSCQPLTPPGGCCPICAAELRILYSLSLADSASKVTQVGPITTQAIIEKLSEMLSVPQCNLFGYLTLEGDIVILIAPVTKEPTVLQVSACDQEAERLHQLIETGSPTVHSHLTLIPLLNAVLRTPIVIPVGGASRLLSPFFIIIAPIFLALTTFGCS